MSSTKLPFKITRNVWIRAEWGFSPGPVHNAASPIPLKIHLKSHFPSMTSYPSADFFRPCTFKLFFDPSCALQPTNPFPVPSDFLCFSSTHLYSSSLANIPTASATPLSFLHHNSGKTQPDHLLSLCLLPNCQGFRRKSYRMVSF